MKPIYLVIFFIGLIACSEPHPQIMLEDGRVYTCRQKPISYTEVGDTVLVMRNHFKNNLKAYHVVGKFTGKVPSGTVINGHKHDYVKAVLLR